MLTLRSKSLITFVCALVVLAVPAVAQVEIPEEWVGIWEVEIAVYDCDTDDLIFSTTSLDTICPGAVFEEPEPDEITIDCTGSADATSYTLHCEGSQIVLPGCTANFVYDASGTRSGETFNVLATTNISFTGDCPQIPDSCQRTETTGTRIGDAPQPCGQTPVESWSWNTVRSLYR